MYSPWTRVKKIPLGTIVRPLPEPGRGIVGDCNRNGPLGNIFQKMPQPSGFGSLFGQYKAVKPLKAWW